MGIFKEVIEANNQFEKRREELQPFLSSVLKENFQEIKQLIPLLSERSYLNLRKDKSVQGDYGFEILIIRKEDDHSLVVEKTDTGYRFDYTIINKGGGVRPSYVKGRETLSEFKMNQSNEEIQKVFENALMKYVKKFV